MENFKQVALREAKKNPSMLKHCSKFSGHVPTKVQWRRHPPWPTPDSAAMTGWRPACSPWWWLGQRNTCLPLWSGEKGKIWDLFQCRLNFGILRHVSCDWTTHIILCKHREVEEGSQIGESLYLSATARAQRFGTPQREGGHLCAMGHNKRNIHSYASDAAAFHKRVKRK